MCVCVLHLVLLNRVLQTVALTLVGMCLLSYGCCCYYGSDRRRCVMQSGEAPGCGAPLDAQLPRHSHDEVHAPQQVNRRSWVALRVARSCCVRLVLVIHSPTLAARLLGCLSLLLLLDVWHLKCACVDQLSTLQAVSWTCSCAPRGVIESSIEAAIERHEVADAVASSHCRMDNVILEFVKTIRIEARNAIATCSSVTKFSETPLQFENSKLEKQRTTQDERPGCECLHVHTRVRELEGAQWRRFVTMRIC